MNDTEAPAVAVEGTDTPASEAVIETVAPAVAVAAAEPSHDAERNRRVIDAAKAERRRVEADRAVKEHTSRIAEERRAFDAERAAFLEERKAIDEYREAIANGRRNPLGILKAAGLSLEDVVRAQLADGEPTPDLLVRDLESRHSASEKRILDEVERLKATLEERDQKEQSAAAERAVAHIQSAIGDHLTKHTERYEYIHAMEQQSEVFDLMRLAYQERNEVLSVEQAADKIEAYLEAQSERALNTSKAKKQYEAMLAKLTSQAAKSTPTAAPATKEIANRLFPTPKAKQTDSDAQARSASTLTNKQVTSPATPADDSGALLSRDDFAEIAGAKLRERKKQKASATAK